MGKILEIEQPCELCNQELTLECRLEMKSDSGGCSDVLLPDHFTPNNPETGDKITDVSPAYGPEYVDWCIIKSYYEETGKQAVTVVYFEHTKEQAEEFFEWANKQFNMSRSELNY
jgi:hypothetical protein